MINYKENKENKGTMSLISIILRNNLKEEKMDAEEYLEKLEESRLRGRLKGVTLMLRLSERISKGDNPEEAIRQLKISFDSSNRALLELEMKYSESQDEQLKYEIAYQETLSATVEALKDSINSALR